MTAAERQVLVCAGGVFGALTVMMPRADTGPGGDGRKPCRWPPQGMRGDGGVLIMPDHDADSRIGRDKCGGARG